MAESLFSGLIPFFRLAVRPAWVLLSSSTINFDQTATEGTLSKQTRRNLQTVIMGDVMVENPAIQIPPHKKQSPASIPNVDSLEGMGAGGGDEYSTLKRLQRELEYVRLVRPSHRLPADGHVGTSTSKRNTSRMSNGMTTTSPRWHGSRLTLCYRSLKRELVRAQEEIKRIQSVPLVIGQFMEAIDQK